MDSIIGVPLSLPSCVRHEPRGVLEISTFGSKTARRVPIDLCARYPLDGSKIQSLEMPPPNRRAEEYSYHLGARDKYRNSTQTLKPILSFSSVSEAEFHLKGSVLYHEHLKSDLRKKYLGGYLEFEYGGVGNDGDSKAFKAWFMVVQHRFDYKAEVVEPKWGDEIIVSWRTDKDEEPYR